jgi:DNA-binding response OmpR family regulator
MLANDNEDGEAAETRAGANCYLVKPFTAQALKDRLVPVIGAF